MLPRSTTCVHVKSVRVTVWCSLASMLVLWWFLFSKLIVKNHMAIHFLESATLNIILIAVDFSVITFILSKCNDKNFHLKMSCISLECVVIFCIKLGILFCTFRNFHNILVCTCPTLGLYFWNNRLPFLQNKWNLPHTCYFLTSWNWWKIMSVGLGMSLLSLLMVPMRWFHLSTELKDPVLWQSPFFSGSHFVT